ncbi:DNA-binding response regulator, NarL/FixJ family, contains REC and HTH domains [Cohaesibacter sp. ES.047]|uniref:response regulator transcription factor n=1 Tax=Cohaesibacter sp. ES.047 TaxID=1798205 RepID=UPI000BB7E491|nr:response regulator transcription factor [Cohaesibacter sp. ES.047]SNY91068.1 DNA-binding response regulator, NarL/FixJ family, contains REC and HTH domains [Cohaesibacter sp. ES.047]
MNILIAEDDPLHRSFLLETVRRYLPDCDHVYEADGGQAAVDIARTHDVDGVVMDVQMPEVSGITAASRIWEKHADMRILFWSNYSDEAYVRGISRIVPRQAVYGYVLKTASAQRLGHAIIGIFVEDQCIVDREVRGVQERALDVHQGLSNTEFEVLLDIAVGLTDKSISQRRGISTRSVQGRLKQLYQKLGVEQANPNEDTPLFNSRTRAVAIAFYRGLLNDEELSLAETSLEKWRE